MTANTYTELENSLNDLDESPMGRVEFGATAFPEDNEIHIQHFKIDEDYRRQGLGTEILSQALDIIKKSNVEIHTVGINLIEEGGSKEFLESFGFEDVTTHTEGNDKIVSGVLFI